MMIKIKGKKLTVKKTEEKIRYYEENKIESPNLNILNATLEMLKKKDLYINCNGCIYTIKEFIDLLKHRQIVVGEQFEAIEMTGEDYSGLDEWR